MNDVKNKMYNYEATPPTDVWEVIASQLDSESAKVIPLASKSNKKYYYMAAASIAVILFAVIFFNNSSNTTNDQFTYTNPSNTDTASNTTALLTVPEKEETLIKNTDTVTASTDNKIRKVGPNQKINKIALPDKKHNNSLLANNASRYITIEGPEGQPVKVSSKMATFIDSSKTKTASKPIWNKKVNEWREIMKANTLAPTPTNFLDIVELTKSLKDNKNP